MIPGLSRFESSNDLPSIASQINRVNQIHIKYYHLINCFSAYISLVAVHFVPEIAFGASHYVHMNIFKDFSQ
jgi:hypothetical protein